MNPLDPDHSQPPFLTPDAGLRHGFTLIEMLVVIAIISILLTAAGPVFDRLTSSYSPAAVASALSAQLERARSHAIAKNTYVWVRLGQVAEEPNDFYVGVYESMDGTATPAAADFKGAWSAPRFSDFKLSANLDPGFVRPPASARTNEATWIRFTPGGAAQTIPALKTESRIRMKRPTGSVATTTSWTEIGLQPTRRGQVPASALQNVASVQLAGLTGQTLQFSR